MRQRKMCRRDAGEVAVVVAVVYAEMGAIGQTKKGKQRVRRREYDVEREGL